MLLIPFFVFLNLQFLIKFLFFTENMFDDIIENRICFGSSQEKWVNILGVFWMIDAAEFGI